MGHTVRRPGRILEIPARRRLRLIHWNKSESDKRASLLRAAGYTVDNPLFHPKMQELREDPPDAVLIDLSRIPSQGRDIAMAIRSYKATRQLPLLLVDGDPEKIERYKKQLPDAVYTRWDEILESLRHAITHPPPEPLLPRSRLEGYSGTPLPKKLGIKPNSVVALLGAPRGFKKTLGNLPENVVLRNDTRGHRDLTIWFVKSQEELAQGIRRMVPLAEKAGLWIAWSKKSSTRSSGLLQMLVRKAGLAEGLVDFKICAIDSTWSGLRFTRRE